ncbi:MAG: hypothetical protein ACREJO_02405 [Phycisphaerales bacterium]
MSHPHSSSHAGAAVIDVNPPGAEHGQHHGHTIVPMRLLVLTLATLLFFTLATVGAAQFEKYIAHTFAVEIPQWVNVMVALSIAAVKTAIVALIFMQLRYDSPVNSLVLFFTIITVALFLGFTMLDLGNRGTIYAYKAQYHDVGGTGDFRRKSQFLQPATEADPKGTYWRQVPVGVSQCEDVRNEFIEVLQNTLVSGGELTHNLSDYHNHLLHDMEELRHEEKPLPEYLTKYIAFLDGRVKALREANKPLPAPIAAYAAIVEEEHKMIPDAAERSNAEQSRVRTGLSPVFAPAGHSTPAPGHAPEHKTEPAKEKPAH